MRGGAAHAHRANGRAVTGEAKADARHERAQSEHGAAERKAPRGTTAQRKPGVAAHKERSDAAGRCARAMLRSGRDSACARGGVRGPMRGHKPEADRPTTNCELPSERSELDAAARARACDDARWSVYAVRYYRAALPRTASGACGLGPRAARGAEWPYATSRRLPRPPAQRTTARGILRHPSPPHEMTSAGCTQSGRCGHGARWRWCSAMARQAVWMALPGTQRVGCMAATLPQQIGVLIRAPHKMLHFSQ